MTTEGQSGIDIVNAEVVPCIIDNQPVLTDATFDLLDPHTHKPLYKVAAAGVDIALKAVESAAAAFPAWSETQPSERRAIFLRAAQLIRTRAPELIQMEITETVSGVALAAFEVGMAADVPEELGALATSLRAETAPSRAGQTAYVFREPYGVVYAGAPWNGPLMLGMRSVANPIMAGNTAVLKTSELSPKMHAVIAEIFIQAGLPAGVLNVIHVEPKDAGAVSEAIIAHPAVGKSNFTGSARVGSILAQLSGKYIKPITLELGGACPFIVLADADVEYAANAAVFGSMFHSGQICMATNSVVIHESVAEKFIELVAAHVDTLNACAESPVMRGLFTAASAKRIDDLVQDALDNGAKIVAGKRSVEDNVCQPLVLSGVTKTTRIFQEELFGPVVSVVTFADEKEALDIVNSLEYGLSSSVYGQDRMRAFEFAKRVRIGAVHINGPTIDDAQTRPHGGFRKSGFGRFNGIDGLREFTQTKIITVNDLVKLPF
ncbi:aldehyde dehydrogenase [Exidia glandulosa HHB12029]|uniref:Aldehyde dehydrogenase n=1 Tax=Exidia glandulosa HHB12029 TaxID=1314781 RepID=A0A166BPF8_EXIGL|nr:aldehyde dehydrogenase [Exidia glandulosa HHB12029]